MTSISCQFSQPSEVTIESLPDELIIFILQLLPTNLLIETASKVSCHWEELSLTSALWGNGCWGFCYHYPASNHLRPIKGYDKIYRPRSLSLPYREDAAVLLQKHWFRRVNVVQQLDLIGCRLETPRIITRIVDTFQMLSALSLEDTSNLSSDDYYALANMKHLTLLNLSHCKNIKKGTLTLIASKCPLVELRLDWAEDIADNDIMELFNLKGDLLKVLTLGGLILTDDSYLCLWKCKSLTELGIAPCPMLTDIGLDAISVLPSLDILQLVDPISVTSKGLDDLVLCSQFSNLTGLILAYCVALSDIHLQVIATRCSKLRKLSVTHCYQITDLGIAHIVQHCSNLEILNLVWNDHLTGAVFLPLLRTHLPQLQQLDLGYCDNILPEKVNELIIARSNLHIVRPEIWCRPRRKSHKCCQLWEAHY